jgi:hypothetical protein
MMMMMTERCRCLQCGFSMRDMSLAGWPVPTTDVLEAVVMTVDVEIDAVGLHFGRENCSQKHYLIFLRLV